MGLLVVGYNILMVVCCWFVLRRCWIVINMLLFDCSWFAVFSGLLVCCGVLILLLVADFVCCG